MVLGNNRPDFNLAALTVHALILNNLAGLVEVIAQTLISDILS